LQVSDELMKRYLTGFGRNFTNEYRTNGTFTTPLGMGEFFALAMPFVIQFILGEYRTRARILAGLSVVFLFIPILFTGSRTGMIGYFMAIMLYLPIWGLQRWRRGNPLGPAVVLGYPVIGAVFLAATFVIGHLRRIVWGGGETVSSNQGRYDQYHLAVPKVLHRPWGYGIGRGGITLNYHDPGGLLTIDVYYLKVIMEFGVLGLLIYIGILASGAAYSARDGLRAENIADQEIGFLNSTMVALLAYMVMKIGFAGEDNQSIVFMMLGAVAALVWRARRNRSLEPSVETVRRALPITVVGDDLV
ncbi:MAG: O-antigen ligase family protein, partial [Caulobacteraceae bacterium]